MVINRPCIVFIKGPTFATFKTKSTVFRGDGPTFVSSTSLLMLFLAGEKERLVANKEVKAKKDNNEEKIITDTLLLA